MRYSISIVFILALSQLSACSLWPSHGKGGFAEHNLGSLVPVEADHPITPAHGLRFDFELQKQLLDQLILKGADKCFPASVRLAKLKQNKCARLIKGQLYGDAQVSILEQRLSLAELERKTNAIRVNYSCETTTDTKDTIFDSSDDKRWLITLLNSDNQFAYDSWKINPKYRINLIHAAKLLVKHDNYHLHIYGHTDSAGTPSLNMDLSRKRSQTVTEFLVSQGISEQRISTEHRGEHEPLFLGNGKEINLVNRRVSIAISSTHAGEK